MKHWSTKKQEAFTSFGGEHSYIPLCFDHWTDQNGVPLNDGYTSDDEYGNCCFCPADQLCPVCVDA